MDSKNTPFSAIYKIFLNQCTDDMYMEISEEETKKMLKQLLLIAIPLFEFPRQDLTDYDEDFESFNIELTTEEMNVLAAYMMIPWFDQQLATCELVRMKYSGADFKFTSQANHIAKLQSLKEQYKEQAFHLQRLYKRRKKDDNGIMQSTAGEIMSTSPWYKTHRGGGRRPWYR
jgi:hypothetical protein